MYELYYAVGTACFAPHMVLEEANLPHRVIGVDIVSGQHKAPEYLSINPAGKVPGLKLSGGQVLTEASAICLYVADIHNLREIAPGVDEVDRGVFLKSLVYLATWVQEHGKRYY